MQNLRRKNMQSRLDESLLVRLPPFSKLNHRQIREILDQASTRRHPEGTSVFQEGHDADRFYLLLDGLIRVVRTSAQGEQVIVLHIPSGQLFGIARALGHDFYPAAAITAKEALTLSWPTTLWDGFVERYDGFATETYNTIGGRVSEMRNRLVEIATQQVDQRIAAVILRLVNQTGRKVDGGIEIDFPISRRDISEMTGTTLHTVSRTMSQWEKLGLIESGRKQIMVRDAHKIAILSGMTVSGALPPL